ncbi:aminodeoxychorismate lyase [Marinobacterium stanieri]|uniref:aminodeoxychorismate lyase n=1 Tax=Marinobacterium stanieri TaxID=49186 RepID=UPI003A959495
MSTSTLINGLPASTIPVSDRGLAYGQGLFETILVSAGQPALLHAHFDRLLQGCQRLGIPDQGLIDALQADIAELSLPTGDAVLKLIVTAGSGGRGYLTPNPANPSRIVTLSPMPAYPDQPEMGIDVCWCETRLAVQPALSGIKHLNRLEQVLAREEWRHTSCREGLVSDTRGFVIEGTMSNLFFVSEGCLHTPDLSGSGINGIMRRQIIAQADAWGVQVHIGDYCPEQVMAADELFLCNSLNGIWPITNLGEHEYPLGHMTLRLQSLQLQRKVK